MNSLISIINGVKIALEEIEQYRRVGTAIDYINRTHTDYELTVKVKEINNTDVHTILSIYSLQGDKETELYSGTDLNELSEKVLMIYKALTD